jgi:hypothetical protein
MAGRDERRAQQADQDSQPGQRESLANHHADHVPRRGAERHPYADFLCPLFDKVGDDAVNPDGRQDERQRGEHADHHHRKPPLREARREDGRHRLHAEQGEVGVDLLNGLAHRTLESGRIAGRLHHERDVQVRALPETAIHLGRGLRLELHCLHVTDDADNRHPRRR